LCAFLHRSMEMVIMDSFRAWPALRVIRAYRHMWVTGSTAGLRCTGSMPRISTDWRLRRVQEEYHGVADEAVPFRDIAEIIGRRLDVPIVSKSPEDAAEHFGFLGYFVGIDCPASSARKRRNGWDGAQPSLG
jgi:hypothetical protein